MKVLLGSLHRHVSDETLSRLISGELPSFRAFRVKSHIESCWQCRSRREALERAAMQLADYRVRLTLSVPPDSRRRQQLLQSLRAHSTPSTASFVWRRSALRMQRWIGQQMTPLLASTAIVFVAGILLFFVWHRDRQALTPAQFLARTTAAEALPAERSGVIYQRISIRSPQNKINLDLYRDAKGIRRRRVEPVTQQEEPTKELLSQAGIDWDAPLSASSYRDWHNRQHVVTDAVHQDDERHLTLVTTLQDGGSISQESLTVRISDFHPIQRTIETRASGTIEIAELSYAVLGWNAVNQGLFESSPGVQPSLAIHIPMPPSENELDVAELSARVSLNRLHADEGEQINVVRTSRGVQVKGVVETNERKRTLISQLAMIPHVTSNILSIPELESEPLHPTSTPLKVESLEASPSPLQTYLQSVHRQNDLSSSSRQLLDAALSIQHNAVLLEDLQSRFGTSAADAESSYKTLLASYADRLNNAATVEVSTLNQLGFIDATSAASQTRAISLKSSAERTESLCRELISGTPNMQRTAPEIAAELYQAVSVIRSSTQLDSNRK